MTTLRVGCGPFPPARRPYMKRFSCVELSETFHNPIGLDALRGWKSNRPAGFDYIPVVWHWLVEDPLDVADPLPEGLVREDLGLLQITPTNRRFWKKTAAQCKAIGARHVLLRTYPSFTPSDAHRDNLRRFVREWVEPEGLRLIWEPRGLWTREEHRALCEELSIVPAIDPWGEDEMPEVWGPDAYFFLSYPRSRRFFSADDFREFLELVVQHTGEVFAVFRGNDRERFARRFRELAAKEWDEILASVTPDPAWEALAGEDEEGYEEYDDYEDDDADEDADGSGDDDDAYDD